MLLTQTLIAMSAPQDDERSSKRQRLKKQIRSLFSSKSQASSRSTNLDVPNTNVPSTSASTSLAVSPAHSSSRVDLIVENVVMNPPSTLPGSMGIGELNSYASCIDQTLNQPARRSWPRNGRNRDYNLSTFRQHPKQSYAGNGNAKKYVLDPCVSPNT